MTYTQRFGTNAVIRDIDGAVIGPENVDSWAIYQAWIQSGNSPTAAPIDRDYLKSYLYEAQARILSAGIIVNVASSGQQINVLCDGDNATRGDLAMLAHFGKEMPAETRIWIDNNNVSTVLTGAQFITLATLIGFWITNTYASVSSLISQIDAGTIITTDQIDAYLWPTS